MSDKSNDGVFSIDVQVTADSVETNVNKAKSALISLGDEAEKTKGKLGGMGDGVAPAVEKMTAAEKAMAASMQRAIASKERLSAEMLSGSKSTAAYYESLSLFRNVDFSKLDGLSTRLKEFGTATTTLAEANKRLATQNDFLTSLKKQSDAIGKTRADLLELQAAEMGVSQSAAPMIAALRSQEAGLNKVGLSAGQLNNSLRQVPAQFTDIFVSLASGQQPLTVFLQQGGQMKDMFGGAGAAAKAMGGYVLGLINPMTIAAATVGTFGYAAHQGAQEAKELSKALILTGNSAGTSVNQLTDIANAISGSTGATKGAAVEALAQIASTGKVAAGNMTLVAESALAMKKATGAAVEDTVKQFAELGKSPVEASLKLNDQYNYLTAAIYEQIKALEDQGKTVEAVSLAQTTFANATKEMAGKVIEDLGYLERGWNGVKSAIAGTWDTLKGIGREDSLLKQLSDANAELAKGGIFNHQAKQRQADLVEQVNNELLVNDAKATQNKLSRAGISFQQEEEKYLDKKVRMGNEISKAQQLAKDGLIDEVRLNTLIGNIKEKYADKERKGGKSQTVKDAEELESLLNRINGKDSGFDTGYIKDVEVLSREYGKGTISLEKFNAEFALLIKQQPGYTKDLREQIAAHKEFETSRIKYIESVEKETESLINKANAAEFENAKIGATEAQLAELVRARDESTIAALREKAATIEAVSGRNWEVEQIDAQIEALNRLRSAEIVRPKLQAQAKEWEKFSDDIERSLTDSLYRSFESADGYAETLVKSIQNTFKAAGLKFVVQYVVSGTGSIVGSAANAIFGTSFGSGGSSSTGSNILGDTSSAMSLYNAGSSLYGYGQAAYAGYGMTAEQAAAASNAYWNAGYYGNSLATSSGNYLATGSNSLSAGGSAAATYGTSAGSQQTAMLAAQDSAFTSAGLADSFSSYLAGGSWVFAVPAIGAALNQTKTRYEDTSISGSYIDGKFVGELVDKFKTASNGFNAAETDRVITPISGDLSAMTDYYTPKMVQQALDFTEFNHQVQNNRDGGSVSDEIYAGQLEAARISGINSGAQAAADAVARTGAIKTAFDDIYTSIKSGLVHAGEALWDSSFSQKLEGFAQEVNVKGVGSMQAVVDMTADQISSGMSAIVLPSINELKTGTETWGQALTRLLAESNSVAGIMQLLGGSIKDSFGTNNADAILRFSDSMVKAFGTIDALNSSVGTYYNNFYSEAEVTERQWQGISAQFAALNLAVPKTREEFRALVDGLDETAPGYATTFKGLMDLSVGFAALTPAIESIASAVDETIAKLRESLIDTYANPLSLSEAKKQIANAGGADLLNIGTANGPSIDQSSVSDSARDAISGIISVASDATLKTIDALAPALSVWLDSLDAASARQEEVLDERNSLESTLLNLQNDTAEIRRRELLTLDDSNRALQNRIWALQDEAENIALVRSATIAYFDRMRNEMLSFASAGYDNLTKIADAEKVRIAALKSVAQESVANIKGIFDLLGSEISKLYGTVSSTREMQAKEGFDFIESALATAQSSGYLPDKDQLSNAVNNASSVLDPNNYATQFEADNAALVMAGQLSKLQEIAGYQLPAAERAVKLADEQLETLDLSLAQYKKQFDELVGIKDNTLAFTGSIKEVGDVIVKQLSSMSGGLNSSIVSAGKSGAISSSDTKSELEKSGVTPDKATLIGGSAVFNSSNGATLIDGIFKATNGYSGSLTDAKSIITEAFNGLPAKDFQAKAIGIGLSAAMIDYMYSFEPGWTNSWASQNGLPSFAVGTNYVPRNMIANIHEGEAIIPKAYNPAISGNNNDRLEKLVESLTSEVQRLQAIVDTGNKHAARTANAVNGNPDQPMLVETV